MSLLSFDKKVVILADASSKLGSECANLFIERGAGAVLNYPPTKTSNRSESEVSIHRYDPLLLKHKSIVRTSHNLNEGDQIVAAAISNFGTIDTLVYHASSQDNSTDIADYKSWEGMREVDILGAFSLVKAAWPYFRKQRCGRIILVAETAFSIFALLGFAHTLAREGSKYGIIANVVAPEFPSYVTGLSGSTTTTALAQSSGSTVVSLARGPSDGHNSSLYIISDGQVLKFRWERSSGIMLNPDENFTLDALMPKWAIIEDFSNKSFPDGPMDFSTLLPKAKALPSNVFNNSTRFDGKVVIITGAAAGLGRCYALAFARLGASVVVNDLADPSEIVREITSFGGTANGYQASCKNGDQVVNAALAAFGHIDILVNNAGYLRDKAFVNMDEATWSAVLKVHMNGTYQMTRAVWPHFIKQGKGSIVNTASTSGIYGVFGQANYSTAKLGVLGIAETAAQEGSKYGIRVNTIAPVASTGALAAAWANTNEKQKGIDMKPDYNVPAVTLLCSDTLNGTPNVINGGLFEIGCGFHASTRLRPSAGCSFEFEKNITPEFLLQNWSNYPISATIGSFPTTNNSLLDSTNHRKTDIIGPIEYVYNDRDVILYNLSVGARRSEIPFVYERSKQFQPLPTFGTIAFLSPAVIDHHAQLSPNFTKSRSVLGEHYLEIYRYPIPTSGRLVSTGNVIEVLDKGNGALAISGYTTSDAGTGEKLFYNEVSFFMGGAGGFGGPREPSDRRPATRAYQMPARNPDHIMEYRTPEELAALYRLNGDREDIHICPAASSRSGFETPILHGRGFLGIAGRHIYLAAGPYRSIKGRFVSAVVPGCTLRTELWVDSSRVLFQMKIVETNKICIASGYADLLLQDTKAAARI
ncbi:NAD(P)-binding protein [Viridothelium virens]|uniref:NAD(P)-binding protein n=1 Tax=Viridothelium virens TaxID=1048519 RepID=A0A6A6HE89_VIRVR|nr:NAD(P)-binding protein [Viridothelium virens]